MLKYQHFRGRLSILTLCDPDFIGAEAAFKRAAAKAIERALAAGLVPVIDKPEDSTTV